MIAARFVPPKNGRECRYSRLRIVSRRRSARRETRHNMADESNAGANGLTPGGDKADPATVFAALAEIIYQGSDAKEMYAAICVAATLAVRGCDHASLLVRVNDRYVTLGASDRLAQHVDDLERRAGDGPCIDAIEEDRK